MLPHGCHLGQLEFLDHTENCAHEELSSCMATKKQHLDDDLPGVVDGISLESEPVGDVGRVTGYKEDGLAIGVIERVAGDEDDDLANRVIE